VAEYREVISQIGDLRDVLARPERINRIIHDELIELRREHGQAAANARRSQIVQDGVILLTEDLIAPQDMVVTLSHAATSRASRWADYRSQRRGGRGKQLR